MDLTSPKCIREITDKFGFSFKKGLGQNFLTDKAVLYDIVKAAHGADGIIEIGPGFGVLTYELAKSFSRVVSVETDDSLKKVLEFTLGEFDNVKIIWQDILKTDVKKLIEDNFPDMKVSIAANLPYYVTSPIITSLLAARLPICDMVIMIQKEVAQRICASPGTKSYGALSVLCQYYTEPELVTTVGADSFIPAPKVDSAVLKMKILNEPSVKVEDEAFFFKTVQAAFSQRRKTLLNCLTSYFKCNKEQLIPILSDIGIDSKRRGETLDLEEFSRLADALRAVL